MRGLFLALLAALAVHALVLLFGGVLFFTDAELKDREPPREVELFEEAEEEKPPDAEKLEELETRKAEEVAPPSEQPPDMKELYREEAPAEASPTDAVARLDALSLSALESALSGGGGGGSDGFGLSGTLAGGGRIGGTGAPGSGGSGDSEARHEMAFDVAELDQGARPVFQSPPLYPVELRSRKVEGTVHVSFIVDAQGKVSQPKVEKSTHEAFEKPALDAVRQWRFDPAVRSGEKVPSRLRIPIRFSLAG